MKTYARNERYWEEVRNHVLGHAQNWKGSEGEALLALCLGEDWSFNIQQYAPAGAHIAPVDCAAVCIRNFLILN